MAHTKRKDTAAGTATDVEQIMVLTELRFALGDNGKRMFPELIEYAKEIYADAMKYRNGANLASSGAESVPCNDLLCTSTTYNT